MHTVEEQKKKNEEYTYNLKEMRHRFLKSLLLDTLLEA